MARERGNPTPEVDVAGEVCNAEAPRWGGSLELPFAWAPDGWREVRPRGVSLARGAFAVPNTRHLACY